MSLQLVKAGLALGLFGGTHKFLDDKVVFILSCVDVHCCTLLQTFCVFISLVKIRINVSVTKKTVVSGADVKFTK